MQETLRAEANQVCARALKDETSESSMDISIQLHHSDLPEEMTLEDSEGGRFCPGGFEDFKFLYK